MPQTGLQRIPGLSGAGAWTVATLEGKRREPGATAAALRAYQRALADPAHRLWRPEHGCGIPECCPDAMTERAWLETVLRNLPKRDRQRLRILLVPLDARW